MVCKSHQVKGEVQSPQVVFDEMQGHRVTDEVQSPQVVVFDEVQSHQVTGKVQSPQIVLDVVHVQAIQVRMQPDTLCQVGVWLAVGLVHRCGGTEQVGSSIPVCLH